MKKLLRLTKTLLVAAGLLAGGNAWADVYESTSNRYDVVFGVPSYTGEEVTGVDVQTDFTADNTTVQDKTQLSLVMSGSVLSGNQANGRVYSFTNPQVAGTVVFKAVGKFVGGSFNFFTIYGVKEEAGEITDDYAIIQSPYGLPRNSGSTTVLRIFGQNITADYVYTPRDVLYGFDVTIDIENQKVDYTVTYASKGSNNIVSELSTVTGSVNVPDGVTLKSVKNLSLPRLGQSGGNYYDNVAFYSVAPATTYTVNFLDEEAKVLKDAEISDSYAGLEVSATSAQTANFTKDETEYTYKSGNDPITLSATAASNVINLVFKVATTPTSYTIKYVDGEGNEIQGDYEAEGYTDDVVTASGAALPTYIWKSEKKYKYASGNRDITLVADAESNVITLVYAEAPKYTYTIKASTGATISSASNYENETVTYYWPRVLNVDGTLYTSSSIGDGQYKNSLTLDEDSKEVTITFTASPSITNLVFLAEGEDIFTRGTGANADIRLSMGAGGYASEKTAIITLPAGSYTLVGVNRGVGSGSNHTFYKGEEEIYTTTEAGYNKDFSQAFTLTETTTIYMQGGGDNRLLDYVYIYGDNYPTVTVTDAGLATYVPAYNLDFSATTIKAYKVSVETKGVAKLTEIETVPAGTPVVLVKDGGASEVVPIATGEVAAVTGNDLVPGTGAEVATVDGGNTNMILNKDGDKACFMFANGQTVAADKAYLHIASSLAPDAEDGARMAVLFFDEVTGISSVKAEKVANGQWFNLAGQRVMQPTKGLYIVNGKKVSVK